MECWRILLTQYGNNPKTNVQSPGSRFQIPDSKNGSLLRPEGPAGNKTIPNSRFQDANFEYNCGPWEPLCEVKNSVREQLQLAVRSLLRLCNTRSRRVRVPLRQVRVVR